MMMILREMEVLNEKQVLLEIGFQKVHIYKTIFTNYIISTYNSKKTPEIKFSHFQMENFPQKKEDIICMQRLDAHGLTEF